MKKQYQLINNLVTDHDNQNFSGSLGLDSDKYDKITPILIEQVSKAHKLTRSKAQVVETIFSEENMERLGISEVTPQVIMFLAFVMGGVLVRDEALPEMQIDKMFKAMSKDIHVLTHMILDLSDSDRIDLLKEIQDHKKGSKDKRAILSEDEKSNINKELDEISKLFDKKAMQDKSMDDTITVKSKGARPEWLSKGDTGAISMVLAKRGHKKTPLVDQAAVPDEVFTRIAKEFMDKYGLVLTRDMLEEPIKDLEIDKDIADNEAVSVASIVLTRKDLDKMREVHLSRKGTRID